MARNGSKSRIPNQVQSAQQSNTAGPPGAPGPKPPTAKAPTKPTPSMPGTWMEENWESWLRPVVYIGVAGIFFLLYFAGLLKDMEAGVLGILVVVGYVWFMAVSAESDRFPKEKRMPLYILSGLIGVLLLVPVTFAIWPGTPLVSGTLKKKGDTIDLTDLGSSGNYLVVAGGTLSSSIAGDRSIDYILEGTSGDKKPTMRGKVEQRIQQTQSRRGVSGQSVKEHNEDKGMMNLDPSSPLTLTTEIDAESMPAGLQVYVYRPSPGGAWLVLVAAILYLGLLFYETKSIPEKGRGYLAAGGGLAIIGALFFVLYSTPYVSEALNAGLARTALGSAMLGGIGGSFVGLLIAFILERSVGRPPLPEDPKAPKPKEEDDD